MNNTIKLTIAYDGSGFCGWQAQNSKKNVPTIEAVVKKALQKVYKTPISVQGASRTDSGVHAKAQAVTYKEQILLPPVKIPEIINKHLPASVRVMSAEIKDTDFNARYSSKGKVYIYRINNSKIMQPFTHKYSWHIPYALDIVKMKEAAKAFIGKKDFKAFTTVHDKRESSITHVKAVKIIKRKNTIYVCIKARNFLHKMVRFMVGSIVEVGRGAWEPAHVEELLKAKTRKYHLKVAPSKGLFLKRVIY
ncbi:MAG: tRNA pseudouridine(38-40) synthase TruA [Elusimicrobiota bacterium]